VPARSMFLSVLQGCAVSKHTTGPWEMPDHAYVKADGDGDCFSGGDWNISPPLGEAGPVAIASSEANARLIAAAPEMFDSLRCMADALNMARLVMKEQETRDLAAALVADARAVLAKASA
jgi:hypothetical protein